MSLGGDLTVGPGLGVSEVGVIAGVGGNFTPIEGTFGPVFNLTDRRACIRTTLGGSAGLAVNAKAWLGDVELSKSFTLDALTADWSYGGPWYWPSDCENLPEPTPTPLPGTPTPTADAHGDRDAGRQRDAHADLDARRPDRDGHARPVADPHPHAARPERRRLGRPAHVHLRRPDLRLPGRRRVRARRRPGLRRARALRAARAGRTPP